MVKDAFEGLYQFLLRRKLVLGFILRNATWLNTRFAVEISNESSSLHEFITHLKSLGYSRILSENSQECVILAPSYLASNKTFLKNFFETHVVRRDLFSDDIVVALPTSLLPQDATELAEVVSDYSWIQHFNEGEPEKLLVYSCYSVTDTFLKRLRALHLDPKFEKAFPFQHISFVHENPEMFSEFLIDSLKLCQDLPIACFSSKEGADFWNAALSFWDLASSFISELNVLVSLDENLIKAELLVSAMSLLRFACINIRINYLEPFTWAAEILSRFTDLLSTCTEKARAQFMKSFELVKIYHEFQEKWYQIEQSANVQWDHCMILKKEITALQVAAYKLERSFFVAHTFLDEVKPLETVSKHFLLNFPTPVRLPIFDYVDSKDYKLVSMLKRKQYVETFCCYDVIRHSFVTVKEIKLIDGALDVAKEMDIVGRYQKLSLLNHPNLVKYISADLRGDTLYLAMEFCSKHSLNSLLIDKTAAKKVESFWKELSRDILTGLSFLHNQGIAHGNIQPGNILQDEFGNFKFVDYGDINRQFKAALSKVSLSYMSNTIPYSAPELILNSPGYDPLKADIWSFGCLLIELVGGVRPWYELEHDYAIIYRLGATKFLPEALLHLPISEAGLEFIKSCLMHEPELRPSVWELLTSSYLNLDLC